MASLLGNLDEVYQLYNEVDHILGLVCMHWENRGGFLCRENRENPAAPQPRKTLSVLVGTQPGFSRGPDVRLPGGAETPPRPSSSFLPSRPRTEDTAFKEDGTARIPRRHRWQGVTTPASLDQNRQLDIEVEEFPVDDFLLIEAPLLSDMYAKQRGGQTLGPVDRSAALFPMVLALMKFRWLLRLHAAFMDLAGRRCSIEHLLLGMLTDTCGAHTYPHSPLQVYELIVQTLRSRLHLSWPAFIAYVNTFDPYSECAKASMSRQVSQMRREELGNSRRLAAKRSKSTFVMSSRRHAPWGSGEEPAREPTKHTVASQVQSVLTRATDDLFVAWLAQQDPSVVNAAAIFDELEYFGMMRPHVKPEVSGIRAWLKEKDMPCLAKEKVKVAQLHAHRLAITIEMPNQRWRWLRLKLDDVLDLARLIVTNPKTFGEGLRRRINWNLEGCAFPKAGETVDNHDPFSCYSVASAMDEDQIDLFLSQRADPQDCGRLMGQTLEIWRDGKPPMLFGREGRVAETTDKWLLDRPTKRFPPKSHATILEALRPTTSGSLSARNRPHWL
eukprot:TRINITY_DN6297_c0_g1_i1.p1 TRINITY_DN6297_c0_g1~~TRINITY_DN6297_c0_g1_i1.p1  ORF type:complete len:582 (-),score=95.77 TRINITY_DN6297_c0_g1_i1:158-1825(-)